MSPKKKKKRPRRAPRPVFDAELRGLARSIVIEVFDAELAMLQARAAELVREEIGPHVQKEMAASQVRFLARLYDAVVGEFKLSQREIERRKT
jgi:hypothetical protein